ncbi:hypothetical protein [Streptomyces sp. 8N706]|uniref:hypothetical protein n=1 Tax=Streptomyces sp. 8N706 TaxID=3457416 RepID=UPI003FD51BDC
MSDAPPAFGTGVPKAFGMGNPEAVVPQANDTPHRRRTGGDGGITQATALGEIGGQRA